MYVGQFWKCFETTGDIETYLCLKEYEKLYSEHTNSVKTNNAVTVVNEELDGMK